MTEGLEISKEVEKVLKTNTVEQAKRFMRGRSGLSVVSVISILESALPLPIITDPFLIAGVLVDRANALRLFLFTTLTSVMGGVIAYYTAYFFIDLILPMMSVEAVDEFNNILLNSDTNTFLLTLVGAVTPVPYTLTCWVVGAIKGNLAVFIIASVLGRGFRYAIVTYCAYKFGPLAMVYVKRYIGLASVLSFIMLALFLWYKL
jgi:membrane protein YqaA with SNARE-associated domain